MRLRVLENDEEEDDAPDRANGPEDVENGGPAGPRGQESAQGIRYDGAKLSACTRRERQKIKCSLVG